MDAMWQEYGMEELEKGMQKLFPASRISVAELMGQLLQGDVLGAAGTLLQEVIQGMGASAAGRKNILIWLIKCAAAFMGIVSDKRVTNCTDHMGNAGMLLFRTAGTAMLLFLITLALLAIGSRGR